MFGIRRLLIIGIVLITSIGASFVSDRSLSKNMPAEPYLDSTRDTEQSQREAWSPEIIHQKYSLNFDMDLGGNSKGILPLLKPAEPMPPTSCRSVQTVPRHPDNFSGPYRVHDLTVHMFENEAGFGAFRMIYSQNDRGIMVASPVVDHVELVSLLSGYEPTVYVLDEMWTPKRAWRAKRRTLDEFERLALEAIQRSENLVWARDAPKRMFGAIRAENDCLKCHTNEKKGDLLGAFTYNLNTRVDLVRE